MTFDASALLWMLIGAVVAGFGFGALGIYLWERRRRRW